MERYRFWFSKRFVVGILAFFGEMNIFALKANFNIAILDMTSKTEITIGNATVTQEPEFDWDSKTKGFLLGVNEYGTLLAPLGGYLAMRFGGSTIIILSNLVISIVTILTPMIIRFNFHLFVVARIVEGITKAFRYVSFPELWSQWSPNRDRSKLMAITLTGFFAGPAITYPVFGLVARNYGWPATFYFSGAFSLLWTAIWVPLVPNSPESDKWISKEELRYIQQDPKQFRPKNMKLMWKNILLSKHVYALGVSKMGYAFGFTITVVCLPMYFQDLTGSKIDKIGIFAAIPTFVNIFTMPLTGFVLDRLKTNSRLTSTQVHKLFMCSALILGGALLITMAYLPRNLIALMTCLILLKTTASVNEVMCILNILSLAPKCSSVLTSFIAFFHMLASIIGPLIVAFIVTSHGIPQWNTSFIIFAIILFTAAVIFSLFGSGEPQPWSYSIEEQNKNCEQATEVQSNLAKDTQI